MTLCLYDDSSSATLLPLTHLHPSFDLRCGICTARERAAFLFPDARIELRVRPSLRDVMAERALLPVNPDRSAASLFLTGRLLLTAEAAALLAGRAGTDAILTSNGEIAGAIAATDDFRARVLSYLEAGTSPDVPGATRLAVSAGCVTFPWDLVAQNADMLASDASLFPLGIVDGTASISSSAVFVAPDRIAVGAYARVHPGAILDATGGPIVVGENAEIMHNAVILGPVFVGRGSRVKIAAKIYGGVSIGPVCKVGGEVEASIFHSHANKQHDGFAGHSYFAPWTNLGADTNTSDLKNNYAPISMVLEGTEYRTGAMFLGAIIADHTKTGINTMLTTGTSAGVGCNIFGAGYPPRYIPSFAWGGAQGFKTYNFDMCAGVADIVMQRRGARLSEAERALLRAIFDATASQRASFRYSPPFP